MSNSKLCIGCNRELSLTCFYKRTDSKHGYTTYCKECDARKKHNNYIKNKASITIRNAKWYSVNKQDRMQKSNAYRNEHPINT